MSNSIAYEDNEMRVCFDFYEGRMFLHCEIWNWTLSVYKRCLKVMAELSDQVKQKGIDELYALAPSLKVARFATITGFEYFKIIEKPDGEKLYLMKMEI